MNKKENILIDKKLFFEIVKTLSKLGHEEYRRNPLYNDEHFHYKNEMKIIKYFEENNLLKEYADFSLNFKRK